METLNFNDRIRRMPLKTLTDLGDRLVNIRTIDVQDAVTAGLPVYPYKYLPVMWNDARGVDSRNVDPDAVVLTKGTIVSLITNQTTIDYGIPPVTSSGTVPVYNDQLTDGLDQIYLPVDENPFGYQESVTALLITANGGSQSTTPYSSLDNNNSGWTDSETSSLVLAANVPVGIVYQEVYQDIRGQYLNYQKHDIYGIACKGFVTIPYVDTNKISDFGSDANVVPDTADRGYVAVWQKNAFLYFDGSAAEGRAGSLVTSDLYGRFVPQYTTTSVLTGSRTAQTVGVIKSCDSRFPKELVSTIQTYPGLAIPGNQTAGLPTELYQFAKAVLTGCAADHAKADILAAVQSGGIGYVRIQLQM